MERLFTVEEAAQMLRLHEDTVRGWLRSNRMRGTKIGRAWRIPEKELLALANLPEDGSEAPKPQNGDTTG